MKMLKLAWVARCFAASAVASAVASAAHADVVVIVNPSTLENSVSAQDVANIFLGKKTELSSGTQVTPVDQEEGSALRDEFYIKIADRNPAQVKAHWATMIFTGRGTPPAVAMDSMEVKNMVASEPGLIGYIDSADVDNNVKVILTLP